MTDRARQIVDELNAKHSAGRSWRDIAKDYPGVTFQALNKIVLTGKLPKNRRIRRALGLLERREWTPLQKAISRMARETRKALKR